MKSTSPATGSLLEILLLLSPESSKTTLRSWIERGRVLVDGKIVTSSKQEIKKGQQVCLSPRSLFLREGVKVLYEDKDLVVIEKPANLLSVDKDTGSEPSVHALLKRRFHHQRVYPVHRLDRDVSGVMVFAYSESARDSLKKTFEKHEISRVYIAIVQGHLEKVSGKWENSLVEDKNYHVHVNDQGQLAITHFEVIGKTKKLTALRLKLETGRKNQIRVQCAHAGHPILGDVKYGGVSSERLFLHAHLLEFNHPLKNKKFSFVSPLPTPFRKFIDIN